MKSHYFFIRQHTTTNLLWILKITSSPVYYGPLIIKSSALTLLFSTLKFVVPPKNSHIFSLPFNYPILNIPSLSYWDNSSSISHSLHEMNELQVLKKVFKNGGGGKYGTKMCTHVCKCNNDSCCNYSINQRKGGKGEQWRG
jgi:hypothetical protein